MTNTDIIQINLSLSGCVSITSYSVSWKKAGQSHFITTWKTLEKFPSNRCRELHPQHCQQSTGGKAGKDTTVTSLAKHHSKQEWALAARLQLPPVQHSYQTTAWELKKPVHLGISNKLFPILNVVPSLPSLGSFWGPSGKANISGHSPCLPQDRLSLPCFPSAQVQSWVGLLWRPCLSM